MFITLKKVKVPLNLLPGAISFYTTSFSATSFQAVNKMSDPNSLPAAHHLSPPSLPSNLNDSSSPVATQHLAPAVSSIIELLKSRRSGPDPTEHRRGWKLNAWDHQQLLLELQKEGLSDDLRYERNTVGVRRYTADTKIQA